MFYNVLEDETYLLMLLALNQERMKKAYLQYFYV